MEPTLLGDVAAGASRVHFGSSLASHPMLDLRVTTLSDNAMVLRARGTAIDLDTEPILRAALDCCVQYAPESLVVDLSEVRFCDVRGMTALVRGYTRATRRGIVVAIAGAPRLLVRMWETFRPDDHGVHYPSVAAALRAVSQFRGTGHATVPRPPLQTCGDGAP